MSDRTADTHPALDGRAAAESYDELPYPSHALPRAHADRMAALAWLHGVDVGETPAHRVLEIGASDAGHSAWVAASLPHAEVVAFDVSPRQVETGVELARRAGLGNLSVRCLDALSLPDDLGTFDTIVCHGVFSWVPAPVRAAILATFGRLLTPRGVGYVSFNVLPGWYGRLALRDVLLRRTSHVRGAAARAAAARAVLEQLVHAIPPGQRDRPYARAVATEHELLASLRDSYVFHELLEGVNEPLHVTDMAHLLDAEGLRLLCRAVPAESAPERYDGATARRHGELSPVEWEQLLDDVTGLRFREQLLVRRDVPSFTALDASRLSRCHLAGRFDVTDDREAPGVTCFTTSDGLVIRGAEPPVREALERLCNAWPDTVPAALLLGDTAPEHRRGVAHVLTELVSRAAVTPRLTPIRVRSDVPPRPRLTALARAELELGRGLSTPSGATIQSDPLIRGLLALLDGSRDLGALAAGLAAHAASIEAVLEDDGRRLDAPADAEAYLCRALPATLDAIRRDGLLDPSD